MKNIIVIAVVAMLALSPIALPVPVLAATASETQKDLLIQLLLEKIKVLQLELQILIKAKESTTKVEITNQNAEYKKEVVQLLNQIEEKENTKANLVKKFEEKKCIKPFRMIVKGGGTTFNCKSSEFEFSATSTNFVLTSEVTVEKLAEAYGLKSSQIKIIPAVYTAPLFKGESPELFSPAKAVVPPLNDLVLLAKQIGVLDRDIADLNTKIKSLKTRYGISS